MEKHLTIGCHHTNRRLTLAPSQPKASALNLAAIKRWRLWNRDVKLDLRDLALLYGAMICWVTLSAVIPAIYSDDAVARDRMSLPVIESWIRNPLLFGKTGVPANVRYGITLPVVGFAPGASKLYQPCFQVLHTPAHQHPWLYKPGRSRHRLVEIFVLLRKVPHWPASPTISRIPHVSGLRQQRWHQSCLLQEHHPKA